MTLLSEPDTLAQMKNSLNPNKYVRTAVTTRPVDKSVVAKLMASEWERFTRDTGASRTEFEAAKKSMPLGVVSSFQHWDPYPIAIASAKGAYMKDVDGRELLDLSMGFGAMLAGHLNPTVVAEGKKALDSGMLFVTPSPISRDAGERLCRRFNIDQVRFANSGTEATMYAVRIAKSYTGKPIIYLRLRSSSLAITIQLPASS